ncbi:MAG: YhfC family glutamic-type intramembrane protease [Lachnospiraceae bacterium]|nr:YhfC family glutamic-type intramembrane protease [Lachnospiraceae bacterium]MEE3460721.1 YhfC family glutamic-type intramembrane protease [Lachnospiraceae bacterium]
MDKISSGIQYSFLFFGIMSALFPILLMIIWRYQKKVRVVYFFAGIFTYLLFARILEFIPHLFFLAGDNPVSKFINGNGFAYAIYGSLMAALFEETGRLFVFKKVFRSRFVREDAISYGIGHGGAEGFMVLGAAYFQYWIYSKYINDGLIAQRIAFFSDKKGADYQQKIDSLTSIADLTGSFTPGLITVNVLERVIMLALQIALSVMVLTGIIFLADAADKADALHKKGIQAIIAAYGIHFIASIPFGLAQSKILNGPAALIILLVITAAALYLAARLYRSGAAAEYGEESSTNEDGSTGIRKYKKKETSIDSIARKKFDNIK